MTNQQRSTSRLRQLLHSRLADLRTGNEAGQALVLALIIVLMISLLPAAILSSLNQELPYATESINYESALAAAEAGVQEYANLMDQYPGYFDFAPQPCPTGATTGNDPGLPGGSNVALGCWDTIAGTSPQEAFTYYPDTSELTGVQSSTNPFGGDVLLVVTGRAGTGLGTQYRRVEAAFTLSGVLTDVYFSNFEQPGAGDLDQWENTYQSGGLVTSGLHEFDEATTDTPAGYATSSGATSVPMATALCQYDADQPNTFIDWYSANVSPLNPLPGYPNPSGLPYGPTNPYYGPWYGTFPDLSASGYQFGTGSNGNQSACNVNYWISGDTFDGPVYSQDELTTCGSPAFTGSSPNLTTEVPPKFPFPATATTGWPGAKPPVAATPPATGYVSYPYGYNQEDNWGGCGGSPTFADSSSPHLGVSQSLPSANQGLLSQIEAGQVAGCVYTGPTMIRFSYNTSTQAETMYVWSPLTKDTYGAGSPTPENTINCGATSTSTTTSEDLCGGTACTGTNNQVSGTGATAAVMNAQTNPGVFAQVPITTNLVIAVQNLPTASTDPNGWTTVPAAEPNAPISGCIDPWVNPDSAGGSTATTCTEGDAILSGAVSYQMTISSSNDIVVSRSLVLGCAVNSTGTYQTDLSGCQSSPDVLGLIALNDIWMSRPYNTTTRSMPPTCSDDTDLSSPAPVTYPGYTGTSWWNNMVPNCLVHNPVIDAATAALNGFFEVEYWREGDASGGRIYFNGSDAVNNAGQFGTFSGSTLYSGYLLNLNYDSRLKADSPPQYLPATDGVWSEVGWVTCANTTPNPNTPGYPTTSVPVCSTLPHSYPPS
jgi:hypothetical protein